jgi:anti-sigma B factor antagonist
LRRFASGGDCARDLATLWTNRSGSEGSGRVMNGLTLGEPFELKDAVCDGRHTLALYGELDIVSAGELKDVLVEVTRDGTGSLILDLSGLTFMDSTGLYMVLFARELTERNGCDFSLIPGSPKIQRVFEVTALLDVLPFQSDDAHGVAGTELRA